ncbi:diadenosine tetraphosphatase [Ceratocystis lukuohia]|uniref:Diadenosine tetraphosphatase n=2 Tax=Ceratocystis TaxID=5157 RepID=A0A0F8DI18_CERFI|nr:diadenosine tetraphosphatase [Ceratocystis platani]
MPLPPCLPAVTRKFRRSLAICTVFTLCTMLYTTRDLFNGQVTSDIFSPDDIGSLSTFASPPDDQQAFHPDWDPNEGKHRPDDDPEVNLGAITTGSTPMLYNSAVRPSFFGAGKATLLREIDHVMIPTVDNKRRLLIIGDVHGMKKPLSQLLAKANYQPETDHLVFLGNAIGSGAASREVLDFAIAHKATLLRADVEDRVVLSSASYYDAVANELGYAVSNTSALHAPGSKVGPDPADDHNIRRQDHFLHGDHAHRALAASLSADQLAQLAAAPAILRVPMPGNAPSLALVHGGLVPGVPLAEQDANVVMTLRGIQYPREIARLDDAVRIVNKRIADLAAQDLPHVFGRRTLEKMVRAEFAKISRPTDRDMVVPTDFADHPDSDTTDPWAAVWNARTDKAMAAAASGSISSSSGVAGTDERYMVVYGHGTGNGLEDGRWTVSLDMGCVDGGRLALLAVSMTPHGMKREVKTVSCGWW